MIQNEVIRQNEMTITEIQKGLLSKSFSVKEVVDFCLNRIKKLNNTRETFITVCTDTALKKAEELDERLSKGEDIGPLGGIPIAIKDNICTKNIKTTCASPMLENFVAAYDADVVQYLKNAGAIIIGKTNMNEFDISSAFGTSELEPNKTPRDLDGMPGSSSEGSASALAAGMVPLAIGSGAGGSIRQSASFYGVVGLKPTYGAVSRNGLISSTPSLDQIGPISRRVKDCELAFRIIKGEDPKYTAYTDQQYIDNTQENNYSKIQGLKIGMSKEYLEQADREIKEAFLKVGSLFEQSGAQVEWFSLPDMESSIPAYYIISCAEAASSLARFDGIRYGYRIGEPENWDLDEFLVRNRTDGFGHEVKHRIVLGTYVQMSEYLSIYKRAVKVQNNLIHKLEKVFQCFDIILMPTHPHLSYQTEGKEKLIHTGKHIDSFTVMMNLTGIPALSLPVGFNQNGLPIGLQLVGSHYSEDTLFQAAYFLEQQLGIYKKQLVGKEGENEL